MFADSALQIVLFLAVLTALAKPLGLYMARAAEGEIPFVSRVGRPLETAIYRLAGVDPAKER